MWDCPGGDTGDCHCGEGLSLCCPHGVPVSPQAVAELGWAVPTAIQAQAIPLALEGRDVLARARTGSGKTGAYGLPLLQKLLRVKEVMRGGLGGSGGIGGHWGGLGGTGGCPSCTNC